MWTIDLAGGELGTIDLTSGTFTPVVQTNLSGWQGLAWDPELRAFFASNQTGGTTYRIDPVSGTTTALGASGHGHLSGLEVDAGGTLWGTVFSGGAIVVVDKTTGAGTQVAATANSIGDFAFDRDGVCYAANSGDDSLYRLDLGSGQVQLVGAHGSGVTFVKGFEITDDGVARTAVGCADSTATRLAMLFTGDTRVGGNSLRLGVRAGAALPSVLAFGANNRTWSGLTLPFDLAALGAPGCFVYTSTDVVTPVVPAGTTIPVPIPNVPRLVGQRLFAQGLAVDMAANRFGVVTSDYVQLIVTR
jgi:hypothetical protein